MILKTKVRIKSTGDYGYIDQYLNVGSNIYAIVAIIEKNKIQEFRIKDLELIDIVISQSLECESILEKS